MAEQTEQVESKKMNAVRFEMMPEQLQCPDCGGVLEKTPSALPDSRWHRCERCGAEWDVLPLVLRRGKQLQVDDGDETEMAEQCAARIKFGKHEGGAGVLVVEPFGDEVKLRFLSRQHGGPVVDFFFDQEGKCTGSGATVGEWSRDEQAAAGIDPDAEPDAGEEPCQAGDGYDEISFPAGTLVKIDGLPFWLASDTVLVGRQANVALIGQGKSAGEEPCQAGANTWESIVRDLRNMVGAMIRNALLQHEAEAH